MSHQSVPARLNEKNVSRASPSAPVQSTSSGICIKHEYFSDQLLMTRTTSTESESAPNEHNIMQSIKVEVKEEEHDDYDKDCACHECLVKRELDFDEFGEQIDIERSVKIGLIHPTNECSRSIILGTSSSSVPPPQPATNSSIQANIKVEIDDSSTVQSVQLCKGVKKKEDDGREYLLECDCNECIVCKVKREIKEEFDESGCESELGANSAQAVHGYTRVKKEEEDSEGESERPNKIQRMDRVVENVPVGSPAQLNPVHTEQDDEEDEANVANNQNDDDNSTEQREDLSADDDERQVAVESYMKRIEPTDEQGNRYLCDYRGCGRRMKQRTDLIRHIQSQHTGERPFKCSVECCDWAFVTKNQLNIHYNSHTGNRPYVCSWPGCEARYRNSSNLSVHFRTHTGVRPFVCTWPECGEAFVTSGNLKTHSRVHSNERPFVCDVTGCRKAYKRIDALRNHQKAKHN